MDPQLQGLQPPSINGGKTPTMAIPIGSSAMGTADAGTSLPYDERYADRPQPDSSPHSGYDIGAYEVCRKFLAGHLVAAICSETSATPPPMTTLTLQASPAGDGTTNPPPGSNMVALNSVVPVEAFPNWGYGFWHWAGPVTDITNPSTTVVMTQPQSVTADFATLKLIAVGTASSNFNVTFTGTQGVTYRLERTPSLIQPNWQKIGNDFTAPSDGSFILSDTTGPVVPGNQFFYRVRVLP